VLNVLQWEEFSDVVLCGHSYGDRVISGVADRITRRTFILATQDQPSVFHDIAERLRHDGGHDIMVDKPRDLADMLLGAV
jgi:hypothetical protein